ncbi:MAG: LysR family transcriptional regulator [Anaerovoracaceae bacterium]
MDINVLKTFAAVCEYAGFSAAAEKLGYSQSTVSSQIRQLEKELDTVLLDRIRHGTAVTSQGAVVLEHAVEILSLYQKMKEAVHQKEEITGEIRLAMADSICHRYFTDDYLEFHNLYPGISLKIVAADTKQMFDMLRRNEVDIVFTLDSHIYDSEFVCCGESVVETHFAASVHHPLAGSASLSLQEITDQPFCLTERDMSYRHLLDQHLASCFLEIHPVLEIGNPEQICSLLKNSGLVSFLPDYVTEPFVKEGSLLRLPVADCSIRVWTQILIHRSKWLSPAMKALIDYYCEIIKKG